jgi:hypothetical protein
MPEAERQDVSNKLQHFTQSDGQATDPPESLVFVHRVIQRFPAARITRSEDGPAI